MTKIRVKTTTVDHCWTLKLNLIHSIFNRPDERYHIYNISTINECALHHHFNVSYNTRSSEYNYKKVVFNEDVSL
jgi:hypothetical protein